MVTQTELLAALENIVDLARFHLSPIQQDMTGEYMNALKQCDEVLKKAKGE